MDHDQVEALGLSYRLLRRVAMWGRIQQPGSRYKSGRVGQPSWIPERPNLACGLITRTSTSIKVVIGRRIEEQGFHRVHEHPLHRLYERLVRLYKRWRGGSITKLFLIAGVRSGLATQSYACYRNDLS